MLRDQLVTPKRVLINQPSKLQEFHKLHGKTGIAMLDQYGDVRVYFTEGTLLNTIIDPIVLDDICNNYGDEK